MTNNLDSVIAGIKKVAWGFLLTLIDINLGTVNILPKWAGYWMMVSALPLIAKELESAKLLKPMGQVLIVYYAVDWVLNIFSVSFDNLYFISIIVTVLVVYFSFQLFTNIAEIADKYGVDDGNGLRKVRNVHTVITTAYSFLFILSSLNSVYNFVVIVFIIINLILLISIVVLLFACTSSLEKVKKEIEESAIDSENGNPPIAPIEE